VPNVARALGKGVGGGPWRSHGHGGGRGACHNAPARVRPANRAVFAPIGRLARARLPQFPPAASMAASAPAMGRD